MTVDRYSEYRERVRANGGAPLGTPPGRPRQDVRTCPDCGRTSDQVEFSVARRRKDGSSNWAYRCKECTSAFVRKRREEDPGYGYKATSRSEYNKQYVSDNPGRKKRWARDGHLKKYGINQDQFLVMLLSQGSCCAICHKPHSVSPLQVDHCHQTEKVRKLLCNECNRKVWIVEFVRDMPEWDFIRVKAYLDGFVGK